MMRLLAFLVLLTPVLSFGGAVFTTLGPGDTFSNEGWLVDPHYNVAALFTPSDSGALNAIRAAIGRVEISGSPSVAMMFSLLAPGPLPTGTVLESWAIDPSDVISRGPLDPPLAAMVDLESTSHPLLSAGTSYWLRAFTAPVSPANSAEYSWSLNVIGVSGYWYSSNGGIDWSPAPVGGLADRTPAFEISTIPEPASGALLLGGLIGLAIYRWRGVRGIRL